MNYVKSDSFKDTRYITKGKAYQADYTGYDHYDLASIQDDDGYEITIRISGCAHLGWAPWTKCDADGTPL